MSLKFKEIASGWKNYIFPSEKHQELAKVRAEICAQCPSAKKGTWTEALPDKTLKKVKGMKCKECGCPLSAKTRSVDSKCPLKKW